MDVQCLIFGIEIPNSDWKKTPPSVKELVEKMGERIKTSEKELADKEAQNQELLEKLTGHRIIHHLRRRLTRSTP